MMESEAVNRRTYNDKKRSDSTTMKRRLYAMGSSVLSRFVFFIDGINQRKLHTFSDSLTNVSIHGCIESTQPWKGMDLIPFHVNKPGGGDGGEPRCSRRVNSFCFVYYTSRFAQSQVRIKSYVDDSGKTKSSLKGRFIAI